MSVAQAEMERPVFFDPAGYPQLDAIREAFPVIRDEGRAVMNMLAHQQFLYGDRLNSKGCGFTGTWARYYLHYCGMEIGVNRSKCPQTTALTDRVPGLVASGFYLLGPHAHVQPHTGICENIKRCHLGLLCPPNCGIRIGSEVRSWHQGELLVFDDTVEHEAWNRSNSTRVVLHLDFFDPPDQDPEESQRILRRLREINVQLKAADHLWLSAARTSMDSDLQDRVMATVQRTRATADGARQVAAIERLVGTTGVFFM